MNDSLTIVLSAVSAIGSSLLTIFLTPWLQHHVWRSQRRDELRLAVITELNKRASEFMTNYIPAPDTYRPSDDFFKAFAEVTAQVRVLFSERGFQAFKQMEIMIGPNLGPRGKRDIHDFVAARDAALRALYGEVIKLRARLPRAGS